MWLSPIIKLFLLSLKVPVYVLFLGTTFDFCNCCCVWMYFSVVQIFGLLLMTLPKIVYFSSGSTIELFSSTRICWGRSSTCNGEYEFESSGTIFCLLLKPLLFLLGILLSNHSLFFSKVNTPILRQSFNDIYPSFSLFLKFFIFKFENSDLLFQQQYLLWNTWFFCRCSISFIKYVKYVIDNNTWNQYSHCKIYQTTLLLRIHSYFLSVFLCYHLPEFQVEHCIHHYFLNYRWYQQFL